jgi:Transposase DDE domain/Insertion element 4 transposase N-terminal
MARTKAVLGSGARLSDYLSASLLAQAFPAPVIHQVLDAHQCNSQRIRGFPAVAGVYYCMALSLYPEAAYEEVFAAVSQGLAWKAGAPEPDRVGKASISRLRQRIGVAPLQDLVVRCCVPLADVAQHPQAFYAGRRLVAIDCTHFEVPDEADNIKQFGYPGSRTGHSGYPQANAAVLVECATHAILDANIGAYRAAEWDLCKPMLKSLKIGMLCLADRGFDGYRYWSEARQTGADLLWRCINTRQLPVHQMLDDGSYLSAIYPSQGRQQDKADAAIVVRVIDYEMAGRPESLQRYRLLTTLLDPKQAPAMELATLYHERWAIEQVFDELKTHLHRSRRVLRSKTADLVRQEFYGWVLAHYAVRWLMHQGASAYRKRHDQLSFASHIQLLKRVQPQSGDFSPTTAKQAQKVVA